MEKTLPEMQRSAGAKPYGFYQLLGLFYLLAPLLFLHPMVVWGAEGASDSLVHVYGYVREAESGETLPGANVVNLADGTGCIANSYGHYSLKLRRGDAVLRFGYVGYQADTLFLTLSRDTLLNVVLGGQVAIEEVRVEAIGGHEGSRSVRTSTMLVPVQAIKTLPMLLGERDVMRIVQLLPGVQSGQVGSTGLYVRGGGPDQNLVMMDGTPIFYTSHLLGLFSIFNGSAIKSMELQKGGFPAHYGGRLSSVLELVMDDGDMRRYHGDLSLGNITMSGSLQGPIVKDRVSFLFTGRVTHLTLLFSLLARETSDDDLRPALYFYDLTGKVHFRINDRHTLFLSGYYGADDLGFSYDEGRVTRRSGIQWGNGVGSLRWNWVPRADLFSNLSLHYSNFSFMASNSATAGHSYYRMRYRSGIQTLGLKWMVDWLPFSNSRFVFGLESQGHEFVPNSLTVQENVTNRENFSRINRVYALSSALFAENELRLWDWGRLQLGIRGTHYLTSRHQHYGVEGRVSSVFYLRDDLSLKASFAQMRQHLHLLTSGGLGMPTDLWVPATPEIPSEDSWIATMALVYDIQALGIQLSLEGYHRRSEGIIHYREGMSFFESTLLAQEGNFWEALVCRGKGWSSGMELLLARKQGRLNGWVGYTLSWTKQQFPELNGGAPFWARYDRRHDVSVFVNFRINDSWSVSATWVLSTGTPFTLAEAKSRVYTELPPTGLYADMGEMNIFSPMNALRMEASHRLDLGAEWSRQGRWVKHFLNIDVYNAYSRRNPFFYFVVDSGNESGSAELRKIALLPILPSLSYRVEF